MSEGEKNKAERLVELLKEEQTWMGRYYGHSGQARVAEREAEYWEKRLAELDNSVEEHIRRKWERNLQKARARKEYHLKQAVKAKLQLRKIREEIKKIMGRDVE